MRRGGSDEDMAEYIHSVVEQKEARHHIGEPGFEKPSRSMVHIGGYDFISPRFVRTGQDPVGDAACV